MLNADPMQFQRVIKNLISNAIDHSNTKEFIEVSAKTIPNYVAVSIVDFGQGIPKDEIKMIFNKYYSAAKKLRKIDENVALIFVTNIAKFAIADLHLSFNEDKPMNIFGEKWQNHEEKIKQDWLEKVTEKDTVLLPGDFSWSMYLKDTKADFEYLNKLPGRKILLKGNHDYWWSTLNKMQKYIEENNFENIDFLYNNSYEVEDNIIAGTRGWVQSNEEEDKKMINRESIRLELSIKDGIQKYGEDKPIIIFMHYPPYTNYNKQNLIDSPFIEIMRKYNVKKCIYGHLHGESIKEAIQGNIKGIDTKLVSADGVNFKLIKIKE